MVAVVAIAILPRLDAVPFRGEEHRRVQVTAEMAARGDWVVPREQGQVFLSRPPLQQWVLAISGRVFPDNDRLGPRDSRARWRVLLTSVLLYGYSRQFVGPDRALPSRRSLTRPAARCWAKRNRPRRRRSSSS